MKKSLSLVMLSAILAFGPAIGMVGSANAKMMAPKAGDHMMADHGKMKSHGKMKMTKKPAMMKKMDHKM